MHEKASLTFWLTLILYLVTIFTVSYVGVYLTYIAIPILVISGLIMKFSTPKSERSEIIENSKLLVKESGKLANEVLKETNNFLDDLNDSLSRLNKVNALFAERSKPLEDQIHSLNIEKTPLEYRLKKSDSDEEKKILKNKIEEINLKIRIKNDLIGKIREACQIEVDAS